MAGGDTKTTAQNVLVWTMSGMLKLLHPFMPYITEEIWQVLNDEKSAIMLEKFPTYDDSLNFVEDEKAFEKVISAIKGIRNQRTEMNIPPSKKAQVFIETEDVELFKSCEMFFEKMAFASEVHVDTQVSLEDSVTIVADGSRCFIPMNELVDKDKELARLEKEKAKVQKDIDFSSNKLNNQGFLAKAPQQQVENEKQKLAKALAKMESINKSIEALK
jgi:valyl-tRNA synthetase